MEPIAIVGRACVLPGALDPQALWQAVVSARDLIQAAPQGRWRLPRRELVLTAGEGPISDHAFSERGGYVVGFEEIFDPSGFHDLAPEQVSALDPLFHWVLHTAREALRDAGCNLGSASMEHVGAVFGNLSYPSSGLSLFAEHAWLEREAERVFGSEACSRIGLHPVDPRNRFMSGLPAHVLARSLRLGAGAFALDAACASALYAIKLACDSLLERRADVMLAGAVNRPDPLYIHVGFSALNALSASGRSRPFHRQADGLLPAEGVGFVVLKRLRDAIGADDRILGVIRGIGLSNDGRAGGFLVPSVDGQKRALQLAFEGSGLSPEDVSLLECHATGTPIGDRAEVQSSAAVYREARDLPIGSLKSNLGHLIAAAGVAGLLKVLGAMEAGIRPPTLHVEDPLPEIADTPFRVLREAEPWREARRIVGLSAFGFGGNNAHVLIEAWDGKDMERRGRQVAASPRHGAEPVAVIGLGTRVADLSTTSAFATALFGGVSRIAREPRSSGGAAESVEIDLSTSRFPPRDLAEALPQQLLVLAAAQEALAGLGPLPPERTGVFVGMACDTRIARLGARWRLADWQQEWGETERAPASADWLRRARAAFAPPLTAAGVVGNMPNVVANRLNSYFDLRGPSFSVSSEELSGLTALEIARRALSAGDIDAAVVGAVDLCCDEVHERAARALLEEGRWAPGDAAVVLVLKRFEDARRERNAVWAVLVDEEDSEGPPPRIRFGFASGMKDLTHLFGHAHAASGLVLVAAATLACRHRALPTQAGVVPSIDGNAFAAEVAVDALGDAHGRVRVVEAPDSPSPPFATEALQIHVYSGEDRRQVAAALAAARESADGPARLAIVAATEEEHQERRTRAAALLSRGRDSIVEEGIYYRDGPLRGDVGFVFTGAAAAYPGMGSQLLLTVPEIASRVARELGNPPELSSWWPADGSDRGDGRPDALSRLAGSVFLAQVHTYLSRDVLGLHPVAALGYSSGETAALFAFGAWSDPAAMLEEARGSGLFTRALAGERLAVRRYWKARGADLAKWSSWSVAARVTEVRRALAGERQAHLAIVNAPENCVIAGDREACQRVLVRLGPRRARPLDDFLAVHCPEVNAVADSWRALHCRATSPVAGVQFFSAGAADPYIPSREAAAQAIYRQAVGTLDFPRVVRRAWKDGVRIFIEHGPRALCSSWIGRILHDREHIAVPLDVAGRSSSRQAMNAAALLATTGLEVAHERFAARLGPAVTHHPERPLCLPAHAPAVRLPLLERAPDDELAVEPPKEPKDESQESAAWKSSMLAAPDLPPVEHEWELQADDGLAGRALLAVREGRETTPPSAEADERPRSACGASASGLDPSRPAPVQKGGSGMSPDASVARDVAALFRTVAGAHRDFVAQQCELGERFLEVQSRGLRTFSSWIGLVSTRPESGHAAMAVARAQSSSGSSEAERAVSFRAPRAALSRLQQSTTSRFALARQGHSSSAVDPLPTLAEYDGTTQRPGPKLCRRDVETLASGKVSSVLGSLFERQDGYERQVRLPEPPLLLVDRVCGIDAPPGVLGRGRIWTETDVREDSWYLNEGCMPPGLAIEAGQADLLLVCWMGADFLNEGRRVYRLLGCQLTFHRSLPRPGETLSYEIQIDGHAQQGDVHLFFFRYDCRIDGRLLLTARRGQAGFFTDRDLAQSTGVLWEPELVPGGSFPSLQGMSSRRRFDRAEIRAFSDGRIYDCFGPGFERARSHVRTPKIQGGRMQLFDEVTEFEPKGGPSNLGILRAVKRISPDEWFFEGHFKNDPCMPGSLMLEGCFQTLAFYVAALGLTVARDGWRFEPIPEEPVETLCRGQVVPGCQELRYEVFVRSVEEAPVPRLRADVLCSVDGRKAFLAKGLAIQLVPDWPLTSRPQWLRDHQEPKPVAVVDGVALDYTSLLACAWGPPSAAFGDSYRVFDGLRRVARLPGPPYHFMSRVTKVVGEPFARKAGLAVEVEYDIPADGWYFRDHGGATMPFAVVMEAALQPCGWLACLAGCPLSVSEDLFFRNLDGTAVLNRELRPDSGTLRSRVELTRISRVGGTILTAFEVQSWLGDQHVYTMNTVFGFFPKVALEQQVGLRAMDADRERLDQPSDFLVDLRKRPSRFLGRTPRLADGMLLMIDRVTGYWPDGGSRGIGHLRAEKDVDPGEWFFKSHFFQDPVQPGSLGVEAMLQLLQFYMLHCNLDEGVPNGRFEPVALDRPIVWKYRGQVVPENTLITIEVSILEVGRDSRGPWVTAEGWLWVDGLQIYHAGSLAARIVGDPEGANEGADSGEEVLDVRSNPWLLDHRPTFTIPALPMMVMVDRIAAAAARRFPTERVVSLSDVRVHRWVAIGDGALKLRTLVRPRSDDVVAVVLEAWRESKDTRLSRFEPAASGRVHLANAYAKRPQTLPPLMASREARDPYACGTLFHGPAFQVLRRWRLGDDGASAELDASGGGVPIGLLNPGLLDGATHAIPHDDLSAWCTAIDDSQVGYPQQIEKLTLHGPAPRSGSVRCEVRFAGLAGERRYPRFHVQILDTEGVWAEMELVEVLFPKGRLGAAAPEARRAFLRDRERVPGLGLSEPLGDGSSQVTRDDLLACDWLPGTVAHAYCCPAGSALLRDVGVKDHFARRLDVHPSQVVVGTEENVVTTEHHPLNAFPFRLLERQDRVVVSDAGPPRLNLGPLQEFWRRLLRSGAWPMEDVYFGLLRRFSRMIVLEDPAAFAREASRPMLYLANHQVAVESLLFSAAVSALGRTPIVTVAKTEHRSSWLGRLIELGFRHPDVLDPGIIVFFNREKREAFLEILSGLRREMATGGKSLLVHVEGTRALTCRQPVQKVSSVLVDLALAVDAAIVPVRLVGGLPVESSGSRLDFPVEFGRQDYWIGRPILPEELSTLPYRERQERVVQAINQLGVANAVEEPLRGDESFGSAVREWQRRTEAEAAAAVIFTTLCRLDDPTPEIRTLVQGASAARGEVQLANDARGRWLAKLAAWLYGPRGPRVKLR